MCHSWETRGELLEKKVFEPFKVMKLDLVAQKLQELDKGRAFLHVPKQLLLRRLRGKLKLNKKKGWGGGDIFRRSDTRLLKPKIWKTLTCPNFW